MRQFWKCSECGSEDIQEDDSFVFCAVCGAMIMYKPQLVARR